MSNRIDTTRLQEMARAYTASAVLYTALDVGLFTQVSNGCKTEEALAKATGLRPVDVDRLVSCALSLELLDWEGDQLCNAPDVEAYLVEGRERYAGPWMMFTRPDVSGWFQMTQKMQEPDSS